MPESDTRRLNRIALTQYWESKGVKLDPLETIDDYVVVPGDKTDWVFYGLVKRVTQVCRSLKNAF